MIINEFVPNRKIFSQGIKEIVKNENKVDEDTINSSNFSEMLKTALHNVNDKQVEAEEKTNGFIKGEVDLHEAMVSSEEARLSLELAVQVRNKLINAYEEFNKMQV